MIRKINVTPNTTASKILFFKETDLNALPDRRIVPLFGANGSGKTTLLKEIEYAIQFSKEENSKEPENEEEAFLRALKKTRLGIKHNPQIKLVTDKAPTMFYRYRNGTDNFKVMQPRSYMESFDPAYMVRRYDAGALSEGQSLVYSVEGLLKGMLPSTKTRESFIEDNSMHVIVLLDEIDSGLSLDNLDHCMRIIRQVLKKRKNVQFIMSFNNPYVLNYFPYVISMYDGKMKRLCDTDDALNELKKNQKMLDKSRKKSNGEYRIFE